MELRTRSRSCILAHVNNRIPLNFVSLVFILCNQTRSTFALFMNSKPRRKSWNRKPKSKSKHDKITFQTSKNVNAYKLYVFIIITIYFHYYYSVARKSERAQCSGHRRLYTAQLGHSYDPHSTRSSVVVHQI